MPSFPLVPAHPRPQVEAITASSEHALDLSVLGHLDLSVLFYPTAQDWPSCSLSPALLNKSSSLTEPCLRTVPGITHSSTKVFEPCLPKPPPSSRAGVHGKPEWGPCMGRRAPRWWGGSLGAPGASSLCLHPVPEQDVFPEHHWGKWTHHGAAPFPSSPRSEGSLTLIGEHLSHTNLSHFSFWNDIKNQTI